MKGTDESSISTLWLFIILAAWKQTWQKSLWVVWSCGVGLSGGTLVPFMENALVLRESLGLVKRVQSPQTVLSINGTMR